MAVVPFSHLQLCRMRRDLSAALQTGDWISVSELDRRLAQALDVAANDSGRDLGVLLEELTQILLLYKQLLEGCQATPAHLSS